MSVERKYRQPRAKTRPMVCGYECGKYPQPPNREPVRNTATGKPHRGKREKGGTASFPEAPIPPDAACSRPGRRLLPSWPAPPPTAATAAAPVLDLMPAATASSRPARRPAPVLPDAACSRPGRRHLQPPPPPAPVLDLLPAATASHGQHRHGQRQHGQSPGPDCVFFCL